MLDAQNQGPQCTACGSPMRLAAIEPGTPGQDLRTFACPRCKRVQRHIIDSGVTEALAAPRGVCRLDLDPGTRRVSGPAAGSRTRYKKAPRQAGQFGADIARPEFY